MQQDKADKGRRSFLAVALPAPVRGALFDSAIALAALVPGVKWARKLENLHLTVRFLGMVDDQRLDKLAAALAPALGALPAFAVSVRGIGAFPTARKAQVVWGGVFDVGGGDATERGGQQAGDPGAVGASAGAGVPRRVQSVTRTGHAASSGLARVAAVVEAAAVAVGISEAGEARPFRGHVTLGRAKPPVDARTLVAAAAQLEFGRFTVGEVDLYESQLSPHGSTYILRMRLPLGPPAGVR